MKGLIRNNFYASWSNIKFFSGVMLLLGIFVIAMDNTIPALLINYSLICMGGFSFNAVSSIGKENCDKWGKYKLSFPVTRADIIKSYYVNHIAWCMTGFVFAAVCVGVSILLHGFPFTDSPTDLPMLFISGFAVSMLIGAVFFPLYYLVGEERHDAVVITSMLSAILLFMGFTTLINYFFAPLDPIWLIMAGIFLAVISLCIFALSFPLSVSIFRCKEY